MAALRRLQSSGAVPSGAMARHGAFIALGAVGISLGAAWAWSQARKRRAPEVEIEPLACLSKLAGCGASPRRRGGKRHKTRITAAQRYSSHAAAEYSDSGVVVAVHMNDSMSPVQGEIMDLSSDVDVIAATMENEPAAEYAIIEVAPEVDINMAEERTTLPPKQAEEAEGAWIAVERRQRRRTPSSPPASLAAEERVAVSIASPEAASAAEAVTVGGSTAAVMNGPDGTMSPAEEVPRRLIASEAVVAEPGDVEAKRKRRKKVKRPRWPGDLAVMPILSGDLNAYGDGIDAAQAATDVLAQTADAARAEAAALDALEAADAAALETALAVSAEESGAIAVEVAVERKEPGSSAVPSPIDGRRGADQAGAWVEVRQRRRGKRNCERPSENDALPAE